MVFIASEGPPNVLLLPVQLRNPSMDCFLVYLLRCSARLADELAVSGNPIEILVQRLVAGVP
jgi:hypothetical protein